ncbi:hypothetical protein [Paraburkholderia fungorum]|uniref:hypothetical protein n=1 Tax=Paraburkholderia fungorum TaxID=134537 RepID=UPI003877AF48
MKSLTNLLGTNEWLSLVASVLTITAAAMSLLAILFAATRYRSQSKYDADAQRAQLSMMREAYDKKLSELTAQLLATEERWKDVNHLQLAAQSSQDESTNAIVPRLTRFLEGVGVTRDDLVVDPRLVFVLTPFDEAHTREFEVIKRTCERVGFRCVRGDEEHAFGDILTHIMRTMVRANLIIANIGSRNANVYYELGIAQALDKATILVSKADFQPAFDLQSRRIVFFSSEKELETKLLETIARMSHHNAAA